MKKVVQKSVHRLIDSLEEGDLISMGGSLRIVRRVNRDDDDRVRSIVLAIRRSSWTNHCSTTVCRADMYHCNLEMVCKKFSSLNGWLDKRFQYSVEHPYAEDRLTAKDVIGVLL